MIFSVFWFFLHLEIPDFQGPVIYENCDSCESFQHWMIFRVHCQLAALVLLSSGFSLYLSPATLLTNLFFFFSPLFCLLSPLFFSCWMSAELSKVTCEIKRKAKQSSQQASWELKAIFYRLPNRSLFYPLHLVINYYNKETLLNKSVSYWFGDISGDTAKLMEIKVKGPLQIVHSLSFINSIWGGRLPQKTLLTSISCKCTPVQNTNL